MLTPAALNFFVSYADGAVESLWSIDQYFEFVLVLMLSTGLAFQVDSSMKALPSRFACRLAYSSKKPWEGIWLLISTQQSN